MPEVPSFIVNLYSWINYLTPVWIILVAIFWKPIRNLFNKEKSRLESIESTLNELQIDIEERKEISKSLLHHEIYTTAREAIKDGYITEDALENLELLYEPYKRLNGNGTAQRLYEECKELPKKKEEEK